MGVKRENGGIGREERRKDMNISKKKLSWIIK
jgi:hypothetical protein